MFERITFKMNDVLYSVPMTKMMEYLTVFMLMVAVVCGVILILQYVIGVIMDSYHYERTLKDIEDEWFAELENSDKGTEEAGV